jgi:hypothetical protein
VPFSMTLQHVPDRELGPLLTQLAKAGFHNPIIKPIAPIVDLAERLVALAGRGRISRTMLNHALLQSRRRCAT